MQAMWALHLFLTPLYIFRSGLPQPGDFFVIVPAMLAALFFIAGNKARPAGPFLPLALFVVLTGLVNMVHAAVMGDAGFLKSTVFYVFNALVFGFGCLLFNEDPRGTARATYYAIGLSLLVQLVVVMAAPMHGLVRESGWFNNPNQLGYWALLSLACIAVLRRHGTLTVLDIVLCAAAFLLGLFSTSKAALACFVVLVPLMLLGPQSRTLIRLVILTAAFAGMAFSVVHWGGVSGVVNEIHVVDKTIERFAQLGQDPDDSLEGRGYGRITDHPSYLLFGAGEGGYERFTNGLFKSLELHSGLGTVLFCYGFAGLFLMMWFFTSVMRHAGWYEIVIGILPLLYGLTHQNMRFTTFWVLLAVIYMTARRKRLGLA